MERKESTPERERKRVYEEKHKQERKEKCKVWGTSLDRTLFAEIDEFLIRHKLTKVALVVAGYEALRQQYEPPTEDK